MWFTQRRPDRPDPARRRAGSSLETLEGRTLLSQTVHPFSVYLPTDLKAYNPTNHNPVVVTASSLAEQGNPDSPLLSNEGKIVSGKDRAGDEWTITVHGPGEVIVTDTSPTDGALDDNIDTITLVGTTSKTYVTGQTSASFKTQTDGEVFFNRLQDNNAVKSIVLNGFTLAQTTTPAAGQENYANTGVFLPAGVGLLQFHNIDGSFDQASTAGNAPITIQIGTTTTPTKSEPIIRLDEIFNTAFSSTAATVPTTAQTTPTVNIIVNGTIQELDIVSSTAAPESVAGDQYLFPTVGTTGRTAVQAKAINTLKVKGSAVNVTASQGSTPFQSGFSGLNHLGNATFGGNADAVGLDVSQGKIGKLDFERGLGNPTGTGTATTNYGTPFEQTGYPASGLEGGLVTAKKIGSITVKEANQQTLTAQNPDFVVQNDQGEPTYYVQPGNALTSAAITSSGSIGKTTVQGSLVNSEIKAGYHYPSHAAGLEGTRARSQVGKLRVNGSLVNGVVSATYRAGSGGYGSSNDVAGPGSIKGKVNAGSNVVTTGAQTPLGNTGAGIYARRKSGGYLPPPALPTHNANGVRVR